MFGNYNKTTLMGRLTADPETRTFANGGKVATFTIAYGKRFKGKTGEWEEKTSFIECKVFNRGEFGKQADNIEKYYRKGCIAFIEGELTQERWETQDGDKRSKLVVYVDSFQVIDQEDRGYAEPRKQEPRKQEQRKEEHIPSGYSPPDEDIPF